MKLKRAEEDASLSEVLGEDVRVLGKMIEFGKISAISCVEIRGRITMGRIRLECISCDAQLDGIDAVPEGWEDVEEVRTYERSIEPADPVTGLTPSGDSVLDWQTHLGTCPECAAEERRACGEEDSDAE